MMSVNTVGRRSDLRMLFRAIALFLSLLVPSAASATDVWAGATGDPCCGLPPEFWKYLDANEVCDKEFPLPPAFACNANPRNLRNYGGPQVQSICAYDTTCTCNTCATASDPNPTLTYYYGHTLKKTQSCSAETPWEYLGLCHTDTPKGKGPCVDCENLAKANPVNIGSGNKYQSETVYRAASGQLELSDAAGKLLLIRNRAGLQQTMTYSTASTPASIAPAAGLLIAATDSFGRQLSFTYNAQRRVNSMTDPAGGQYLFEYDGSGGPAGAGNLTKLTFPDTKTRVYFYKEAAQINGGAACSSPSPVLNNALTGLSDENDSRYATWTYDCQVRVTSSVHALGVGLYSFNYGTGTSTASLDSHGP